MHRWCHEKVTHSKTQTNMGHFYKSSQVCCLKTNSLQSVLFALLIFFRSILVSKFEKDPGKYNVDTNQNISLSTKTYQGLKQSGLWVSVLIPYRSPSKKLWAPQTRKILSDKSPLQIQPARDLYSESTLKFKIKQNRNCTVTVLVIVHSVQNSASTSGIWKMLR